MALLHKSLPQSRLVGVGISYIFIFPGHPTFWTPFQILHLWGHWLHPVAVTQVSKPVYKMERITQLSKWLHHCHLLALKSCHVEIGTSKIET